jgi:hypothetical protein
MAGSSSRLVLPHSAAELLRSASTALCTTQHSIIALPLFATDDARSMCEKRNGRSRNFLSYKEFGVRYPAKGVKYPPPSPTILYKPFLFSFKNWKAFSNTIGSAKQCRLLKSHLNQIQYSDPTQNAIDLNRSSCNCKDSFHNEFVHINWQCT